MLERDAIKARKALPHYFNILEGREKPNFHLLKMIPVKFEPDMDMKLLWDLHKVGMEMLKKGEFESEVDNNLLDLKATIAKRMLKRCELCEFKCGINREKEIGYCRVKETRIATAFLHMGEEPELVPSYTIFFSGCNFRCVFCQNWDISQYRVGEIVPAATLAKKIERAYYLGAKNVNFVGGEPTPNIPYILELLNHLNIPIPIIWNSNMYLSVEGMKLLDGVVDLYLADFKWFYNKNALKYSKAPNYWDVMVRNFLLAKAHYKSEFLIRHLVVPGHLKDTEKILRWIADNIGKEVRINVMFQYRPEFRASRYPEINRTLTVEEMGRAKELVEKYGFENALVG